MLSYKVIVLYFVFFTKFVNAYTVLDLGGVWNVKDAENEYDLNAKVPGGIYSDLMENNIIDDVFYGSNDVDTRWVSKKNWTYSTKITIPESVCDHEVINLVFDGVDTFADIYVNDVLIGTTDNMFVQYAFNVKPYVQTGDNSFVVKFLSPVEKAALLYQLQAQNYSVPPECVPDVYNGECHANHVRKMQASFSWDWGPAFPSVGIWKPVYLETYNLTGIRDVTVDIKKDNSDTWSVTPAVYLSQPSSTSAIKGNIIITLYTDVDKIENVYEVEVSANENGDYLVRETFTVPALHVSLWWPNGYGDAVLYRMKVTFIGENEEASVKRFKVGFRTVTLDQSETRIGRAFYFIVNNVPIFAKGTNSIPVSVLPERGQDPDTIRFLLQSAKDVHMNMIRVWGGGTYESDMFYQIADEFGIMIWQDFMFACSMYPVNNEFLSTVKKEVRHQVRRLQHHPSIVLWAGNNENEAALQQNWYGTASNYETFKADYIQLYVDTIKPEVLLSDSTREFLVSSPTNGIESENEGYISDSPQSNYYGDVHYYNYLLNPWEQNNYPIPRFASEYGLQSLPMISTWLTATNNTSDLHPNSDFMQHRQHHPAGRSELRLLMWFQLALPDTDSENYYKAFIYFSQIIQAMGMKRQTEYYRLFRSNTNIVGEGLTMGALYWQLNDVWVAPTWSGIDFKNNWKMMHYFARNFFAPIIITPKLSKNGNMDVYVVSDLITTTCNNSAIISVYKWDSLDVVHQETGISTCLLSGYSTKIYSTWVDEYLVQVGCGDTLAVAQTKCFIVLSLMDSQSNAIAPDNFVFPTVLKKAALTSANVTVESVRQINEEGIEFEIQVKTDAIALFVWLESGDIRGLFSDNGFLQMTATKIIRFTAESATDLEVLTDAITVTHLKDPQYY